MGGLQGHTRAIKPPITCVDLLQEAAPLLFPLGEHLTQSVYLGTPQTIRRAFLLPKVSGGCPSGIAWPMDISFKDLFLSIKVLSSNFALFLVVLEELCPQLMAKPSNSAALSTSLCAPHN
jgi:hypothetical protein